MRLVWKNKKTATYLRKACPKEGWRWQLLSLPSSERERAQAWIAPPRGRGCQPYVYSLSPFHRSRNCSLHVNESVQHIQRGCGISQEQDRGGGCRAPLLGLEGGGRRTELCCPPPGFVAFVSHPLFILFGSQIVHLNCSYFLLQQTT